MSKSFPVGFRHPKTHHVYECQFCGAKLPASKELPYGFYVVCEKCVKEKK